MSAPRNAARPALGRGLGALIPSPTRPVATAQDAASAPDTAGSETLGAPREIPVDAIDPNPEQPRRTFDEEQIGRLADSIERFGVLQPVVVRQAGERFELIVGERRWRATQVAGLRTIPAVVAEVASDDRLTVALVENVQRHDLNPIELAHAYRTLSESGATQEEIGTSVGVDRSSVANHIRLLDLTRSQQEDVEQGRLSMGHAKALLQVSGPERRLHLRDRIVDSSLSVRESEELARKLSGAAPQARPRRRSGDSLSPELSQLGELLQKQLQARVRIHAKGERGRIEIEYSGGEDLERIARILLEGA